MINLQDTLNKFTNALDNAIQYSGLSDEWSFYIEELEICQSPSEFFHVLNSMVRDLSTEEFNLISRQLNK